MFCILPVNRNTHIRRKHEAQDGAVTLEFAAVLPILLLIMMGIIEFSMIMFVTVTLDGAVTVAAREGTFNSGQVNTILAGRVYGLLNAANITVNGGSSSNPQPPTTLCSQPTCPNNVVLYTVTYPWHLLTPLLSQIIGSGGIFTLSSTAVVTVEPGSSYPAITN